MPLQTYNPRSSLTTATFWKNGVLMATIDAAICFFIPYYATVLNGGHMANDVFSIGKTTFVALLGELPDIVPPEHVSKRMPTSAGLLHCSRHTRPEPV